MMELLSVTDAAVKALDRSSRSQSSVSSGTSSKSDGSMIKNQCKSVDSGIKTLTPLLEARTLEADVLNNGERSSDDSTTASDVLIRSTIADRDASLIGLNISNASKCSKASLGFDNFNVMRPQKVKISSKLLREIQSPLEVAHSEYIDKCKNERIPPALSNANDPRSDEMSGSSYPIDTHHIPFQGTQNTRVYEHSSGLRKQVDVRNKTTNALNVDRQKRRVDNQYYVERHTPQKISADKTSFRENNDESQIPELVSNKPRVDLNYSVDLIPQKEVQSNSSSCSSQPEIITIPEKIVTISARTSLSDTSENENGLALGPTQSDVGQKPARFQIYNRATGISLKQGAPVVGIGAADRQKETEDIHISKFGLTDRQKHIKDSFMRRYDQAGPVKRMIQPKFVGQGTKKVPDVEQKENVSGDQMGTRPPDVITAAVAASAAVAATQPFLRSQYELETKVTQILDRITTLPSSTPAEYTSRGPSDESHRIKELEKQVSDLTEKRIDYLEKLQHQQFEMQAQLLSVSRTAPSEPTRHHHFDKPLPQQHEKARHAVSKPVLSGELHRGYREKAEKPYENDLETSPLDTPAPRSRAPKPVAYEPSSTDLHGTGKKSSPPRAQRTRGLLEEILASAGSPGVKSKDASYVIPKQQFSSSLVKRPRVEDDSIHDMSSATVSKASHLVKELSNLRQEMQGFMSDARVLKQDAARTDQQESLRDTVFDPSPLDAYLKCPTVAASPYKSVPDLSPNRFNAPLPPGFSEAEKALKQVEKNRGYFEANLETVLRSQQDAEVYTLIENLYQDSTNVERNHIKHLVDKCICALKPEIQKEVEAEEVLLTEMMKSRYPVRPQIQQSQRSMAKSQVKGITGARVDTGLRKIGREPAPTAAERRAAAKEKENIPVKMKPALQKKVQIADEDYMTKVYGKAAYQNKRTTVKDPYLHFQNISKPRTTRPPLAVEIKGTELKSAKTQTSSGVKQFYFSPQARTYIPLASGSVAAPIPGQLIPMAIPLREPRLNSGLTVPITMTTPSSAMASTPAFKTQVTASHNVTLVSLPVREDVVDRRIPELGKQVLPAVDIDSELSFPPSPISEVSLEQRAVHLESPQMSPSKTKFEVMFHDASPKKRIEESESEYSDDDAGPETATGMSLPGHQQPDLPQQYNGPDFPPTIPIMRQVVSSDVIAEDMRRRDLLENKAAEWIEQELMARIVSEMYPLKSDQAPDVSHIVSEHSEDSMADYRQESMFVTEALGQDGVQLFIDAGQPVDSNMVNMLIREVLAEKVSAMLAQAPEGQKMAQEVPEPKTGNGPTIMAIRDEYNGQVRHVATPQPTPKSSPVTSPIRIHSPLATPPGSPRIHVPQGMRVFDNTQAITLVESEAESTLSLDISEELKKMAAKLTNETTASIEDYHDIATPVASPTPEIVVSEERHLSPPVSPRDVRKPTLQLTQTLSEPEEPEITPSSPKPWGDSESPLPEENPDYVEKDIKVLENEQEPFTLSVRPLDDMAGQSMDFRQDIPSPTPILREEPPSPELSESESLSSPSMVSDTVNQSVSEGQWLISRSEGEAADFCIDEATRQQMFQAAHHRTNISTASSLKYTDEIEDEFNEVSQSEGEFLHESDFPPEKDPILALLTNLKHHALQHQPISFGQVDMTANEVHNVLNTTSKSMGEITFPDKSRMSFGEVMQSEDPSTKSSGEIKTDIFSFENRRSFPQKLRESDRSSKRFSSPLKLSDLQPQSHEKLPLHEESLEQLPLLEDSLEQIALPNETLEQSPVHDDESLEQIPLDEYSHSPSRLDAGHVSPTIRHLATALKVPASMVTVTAGGRSTPLKSSLRKPPQMIRSQTVPTKSVTTPQPRVVQVRSSEERKDSYGNTQGFDINSTLSERPLTMTPDQMNTDAFLQSGYLTQSLSQSENGTHILERHDQKPVEFKQLSTDQTMDQGKSSIEFRQLTPDRTMELGRSLGLSYSFESEESSEISELRRLAGSGTLKMSVTIPTIGQSDEESENISEVDMPSGTYFLCSTVVCFTFGSHHFAMGLKAQSCENRL